MSAVYDPLMEIAGAQSVRVFLAAIVGSHMWEYAQESSDRDVAFIFVRPRALLFEPPDVIEQTVGGTQYTGWDIAKFLRLVVKGNPQTQNICASPLRLHHFDSALSESLCSWVADQFDPIAAYHHWYNIALSHYRRYIQGALEEDLDPKKYIVTVQALLNVRWLLDHATFPPVSIRELTESSLRVRESMLLRLTLNHLYDTRQFSELGGEIVLNWFINSSLENMSRSHERLVAYFPIRDTQKSRSQAEDLFQKINLHSKDNMWLEKA